MYTLPELKVHISHLTRKNEVALQRNETPCGFEELNILESEGNQAMVSHDRQGNMPSQDH